MNQRFEVYEEAMSTVCSKWSKSEYIDPVCTYRLRMFSIYIKSGQFEVLCILTTLSMISSY